MFSWLDKNIKKMRWYDISLLKASVFLAALMLITAVESFREFVLSVQWYYYLILMLLCMIIPMKRMFF